MDQNNLNFPSFIIKENEKYIEASEQYLLNSTH